MKPVNTNSLIGRTGDNTRNGHWMIPDRIFEECCKVHICTDVFTQPHIKEGYNLFALMSHARRYWRKAEQRRTKTRAPCQQRYLKLLALFVSSVHIDKHIWAQVALALRQRMRKNPSKTRTPPSKKPACDSVVADVGDEDDIIIVSERLAGI